MINKRRLVTIRQAWELASVSRRTIYNWIRDGKVEYVRTAGGSVRIYVDSIFKAPTPAPPPPAPAPILRAHNLPPFPQGPLVVPSERAQFGVENPGQKLPMAKASLQ